MSISRIIAIWMNASLLAGNPSYSLRTAPVPALTREMLRSFLGWCADQAVNLDLPQADREFWGRMRDPVDRDRLLDDPDFYHSEGNVLAIGRVPEA